MTAPGVHRGGVQRKEGLKMAKQRKTKKQEPKIQQGNAELQRQYDKEEVKSDG